MIFLFTDIEGSTQRWESKPDAMGRAVRRHDEIVRGAIEARGGSVFKTVGDAFCAIFGDARAALEATVDAQRRLQSEDWSEVGGLPVRMALHAGDAEERDGDYFGGSVNRVARLMGAAHGRQIVVSGAVADALAGALPENVSLLTLGVFRLKDLRERERVLQVVAPGLASAFKPLRSLDAVPNNLPEQTSGFVGREHDIVGVSELLRESTLATITGPGGVGKTRLALQCAAETIDRMQDGAWFVTFGALSDPQLIPSTILAALGVPGQGVDATETLLANLVPRELLLVLDNCEHLIEDAARTVEAIRARCPRVTVLDTSREPFRLNGELLYRLAPLDPGDARRLFAQRARAVDSRFHPDAAAERAIDGICAHLDGIPLAIELAAARLQMLSLEDIASMLGERFRMLTGGSRTALPRQQTLRAMIDWSYELLSDAEKQFFRRLSVFRGGFTLAAAAAVCAGETADEWAALDLLTALVDKSLVVADAGDGQRRYRLLESIREFGLERQSEANEAAASAERHARYFARLTREATAETLAWDLDNLRAAVRWSLFDDGDAVLGAELAADVAPVVLHLSILNEGIAWCAAALERDLPGPLRGRLEYALSMFYNNRAEYASAMASAERALQLLREGDDERILARARAQVAQQYARAGKYEEAMPYATAALAGARSLGDARLLADVTRRSAFSLPPSEIERARAQFAEAIALLEPLGADDESSHLLEWWAEAEAAAEHYDRAFELGMRALDRATNDRVRMHVNSNVAGYALAMGDVTRAGSFARRGLELAIAANHPLLIAVGVAYVAPAKAEADPGEAARLFGYARAQMAAHKWSGIASDERARATIEALLAERAGAAALPGLLAEGAAWNVDEALARVRA
ncbi:MAG TPA: adenylate/guanylate cyclase domain-containing protein [Candidatus Baltobacteraceae bacterium]